MSRREDRAKKRAAKAQEEAHRLYIASGGDPAKWELFQQQSRYEVWHDFGGNLPEDLVLSKR